MHILVSSEQSCKRSRQQECSRCVTLFSGDSKPLKSLRGISVHRHDFDLVESNWGEVAGECFDPLSIVVSHSDAFGEIENSVDSIFLFVTRVASQISFVFLEPKV